MKRTVALVLLLLVKISWSESLDHLSSKTDRASGSAAQSRAVCEAVVECSEILSKDAQKVKAGTGQHVYFMKTETQTVKGFFKNSTKQVQVRDHKWVPAEYVTDVKAGTVLRTYTRPFRAFALDTEASSPEGAQKEARARLDRATKAIAEATPKDLAVLLRRERKIDQFQETRLSCQVKDATKATCRTEPVNRQTTLNDMLVPQTFSGNLVSQIPNPDEVWVQFGKGSVLNNNAFPQMDPFYLGDSVLMKEALQVKQGLPVPDRMYCYYVVEKTRPFLTGEANHSSYEHSNSEFRNYDRNFLFLFRRASAGFSTSSASSSHFSFHLNTHYQVSSLLVLEDIAERRSYTNPVEMKQDSCNRAQERYLVANTFADVVVGCRCSSQRVLPNGTVSDYRIFEY